MAGLSGQVGQGLVQQLAKKPPKQYEPTAQFKVVNAPGGSYQVYSGGQKRFVPAGPAKVRDLMVGRNGAPKPKPSPYQLDSQYFADIAQQRFKAQQQTNQLGQDSAYDRTDFQEALRRLGQQQGRDVQTTRENAAREGLFYSGQLGKREGDVNTDYARRTGDARLAFDRREAGRMAARRALQAGASIDEAAARAAAVERQLDRDATSATAGTLARNPKPRTHHKPRRRRARRTVNDMKAR
jgi:hypothetical protein